MLWVCGLMRYVYICGCQCECVCVCMYEMPKRRVNNRIWEESVSKGSMRPGSRPPFFTLLSILRFCQSSEGQVYAIKIPAHFGPRCCSSGTHIHTRRMVRRGGHRHGRFSPSRALAIILPSIAPPRSTRSCNGFLKTGRAPREGGVGWFPWKDCQNTSHTAIFTHSLPSLWNEHVPDSDARLCGFAHFSYPLPPLFLRNQLIGCSSHGQEGWPMGKYGVENHIVIAEPQSAAG
ncbi:hypothetical protein LZ32DRAFT_368356 [Colletotrichum eremochloae]|nr:hypothetical protein LZ32DRAFT_368356 [Colletotrichum eremochloae]